VTVAVRQGAIYCVPALGFPSFSAKIVIIAASAGKRRIRTREPTEEKEKLEKERWCEGAGSGRRAVRIRGGERSFPSTSPLDSLLLLLRCGCTCC
jgi:hypothetical protein